MVDCAAWGTAPTCTLIVQPGRVTWYQHSSERILSRLNYLYSMAGHKTAATRTPYCINDGQLIHLAPVYLWSTKCSFTEPLQILSSFRNRWVVFRVDHKLFCIRTDKLILWLVWCKHVTWLYDIQGLDFAFYILFIILPYYTKIHDSEPCAELGKMLSTT